MREPGSECRPHRGRRPDEPRAQEPTPPAARWTRRDLLGTAAVLLLPALAACRGRTDESAGPPESPYEVDAETVAVLTFRRLAEVYTGTPYSADVVFETTIFDEFVRYWWQRAPRGRYLAACVERLDAGVPGAAGRFHDLDAAAALAVVRREITGETRKLYEAEIVRPILQLYASDGAWLAMGYRSAPGRPRGLADYREPPLTARWPVS